MKAISGQARLNAAMSNEDKTPVNISASVSELLFITLGVSSWYSVCVVDIIM